MEKNAKFHNYLLWNHNIVCYIVHNNYIIFCVIQSIIKSVIVVIFDNKTPIKIKKHKKQSNHNLHITKTHTSFIFANLVLLNPK